MDEDRQILMSISDGLRWVAIPLWLIALSLAFGIAAWASHQ